MGRLGQPLGADKQFRATPFAPRCTKDEIEERLFESRRDLFAGLDLVFFDTTSIYFEGAGGQTIGKNGHSKDHRPNLKQMVVGMILDNEGNPLCSEMWPGNVTDVKTLVPVVDRLKTRFGVGNICMNEEQATKDRADREAIVCSLREALKRGDKLLIGNKGYRRC